MKNFLDKIKSWKSRITIDNTVDALVDVFLVVFDVLSSPILIVMRIIRFIFNKYFNKRLKAIAKWITHKVINQQIIIKTPKTQDNLLQETLKVMKKKKKRTRRSVSASSIGLKKH